MSDEEFMAVALEQARTAALAGEVPVGAAVVWRGRVIATGRNAPVYSHDPTAHAEILALRSAAKFLGNYRLNECELFVTLEPCAMCSGAILNARLKRVVFGAFEPKTGAAGSVVNLFTQSQLNHQTELKSGVSGAASSALLQDFFRHRRSSQRILTAQLHPLRDDSLRTPDLAFEGLSEYPWTPQYCSNLPSLEKLRLHYLDEQLPLDGPNNCGFSHDAAAYLCLHDEFNWSYQFRQLIAKLLQAGHRVVAPDLIGFGKSDKPKKEGFHTLSRHCQILSELVEQLDLRQIILVLPEQSSLVRLIGMMLPMYVPQRYQGLLTVNSDGLPQGDEMPVGKSVSLWNQMTYETSKNDKFAAIDDARFQLGDEIFKAYDVPFPMQSFRSGQRAFANKENFLQAIDSLELQHRAEQFWQHHLRS